jgi:epoxyqueuosine reductase
LKAVFEKAARARGFSRIGVASAGRSPRFDRYRRWIENGYHARMAYLEKSLPVREDPAQLLPGVRSIVVLSRPHPGAPPEAPDGTRTARYALSPDYHRDLRRLAEGVVDDVRRQSGAAFAARVCVDSAPLPERALAAAAGIGWIGKNGMVMNAEEGSYFLLAEILTDLELSPDSPVAERCGSCRACLDACPMQAFVAPAVLDSHRCLSYWTIEQRETIPTDVARKLSGWVFGCDICQEACPYNRAVETGELARQPPALSELLAAGAGQWRRRFADTPLARAGQAGLRRNAAALAEATRRGDLLPALAPLATAGSAVVAAQARRAIESLAGTPQP